MARVSEPPQANGVRDRAKVPLQHLWQAVQAQAPPGQAPEVHSQLRGPVAVDGRVGQGAREAVEVLRRRYLVTRGSRGIRIDLSLRAKVDGPGLGTGVKDTE
ncbi:uncharacterized protein LOC143181513 isoform X2 [Calliopsis andreniformis]|uniref:uncharacterized protein LOC143181513 isoform X1 n=1 Tax=Calliopsis andreniformis TaxID=337506 RepID=UPI003FCD1FAD